MAKEKLKCPECERSFSTAAQLAHHIYTIHGRRKSKNADQKKTGKRTTSSRVVRKRALSSKRVVLTTGYEVELADEGGLEHLFTAIAKQSAVRRSTTPDFAERVLESIFEGCLLELHYVAGQLRHAGSGMDLNFLLREFGVQWERLMDDGKEDNDDQE